MLSRKQRKKVLEEAKRQIYAQGILENNIDSRPVNDLKDVYLKLNSELFDGCLPEDLEVIYSLTLNKGRSKSIVYGKCYYSSTGISKRGHRKNCTAIKIEIKPGMTASETRKTLVHEMCHVFCFNRFGEVGHGRQFWIKMKKCGYPRGHELPSQRDKWSR